MVLKWCQALDLNSIGREQNIAENPGAKFTIQDLVPHTYHIPLEEQKWFDKYLFKTGN